MTRPVVLHVAAVAFTARKLLLPQMRASAGQYDIRLACAPELDGAWLADLNEFRPLAVAFPRSLRTGAIVQASVDLVRAVQKARPAIVHLHSPAAALPARLVPRSAFAGAKIIYTVHGFPFMWDRLSARDRALLGVEWALSARTDLALFQSREDLQQATRRRFPVPKRYLGNGVEDDWFGIPFPERRATRPLTLLFVGRLVREKGIIELLNALEGVPGVRLLVAGAALDSDRDDVTAEVRYLASRPTLAGRVVELGLVSRAELRLHMAEADGMALPSHREGLPRSVIEALASGRPSIVTNIRGCRELVATGTNGWVVPPRSVAALRVAIADFAGCSAGRARALAEGARAGAQQYRETEVFKRLHQAYAEVLDAGQHGRRRPRMQGDAGDGD